MSKERQGEIKTRVLMQEEISEESKRLVEDKLYNMKPPPGAAETVPPSRWPSDGLYRWRLTKQIDSAKVAFLAKQVCLLASVVKHTDVAGVVAQLVRPDGPCVEDAHGKLQYPCDFKATGYEEFAAVNWVLPARLPPIMQKTISFSVKEALYVAELRGGLRPTHDIKSAFARQWIKISDGKERISEADAPKFVAAMREAGYFKGFLNQVFMKRFEGSDGCPMLPLILSCTDDFFEPSDWNNNGDPTEAGVKKLIHKAIERALGNKSIKIGSPEGRDTADAFLDAWAKSAGNSSLRIGTKEVARFAQLMRRCGKGEYVEGLEEQTQGFKKIGGRLPFFVVFFPGCEDDGRSWLDIFATQMSV